MNDFNRCNKRSGVHWTRKPIKSLNIKIQLKPQINISLPHFESFTSNAETSQIDTNIQEYSFKWQQKVLNAWQMHRYSDPHNCITDTELNYHQIIKNSDVEPSKVFTYIHDDNYLCSHNTITEDGLTSCMERLDVNGRLGKYLNDDSVSMGRLFRSEENITSDEHQIVMHVVLDNSEYNEDLQLLSKQEAILLTLSYNPAQHCLIVTPDLNNLEWNPYTVVTSSGERWNYEYAVDLVFDEGDQRGGGEELTKMLQKLRHKWHTKHKPLLQLSTPAHHKKLYVVLLEVLSAREFDAKDLYIEFYIKFPEDVITNDARHGRTHLTSCLTTDGDANWCYAHLVELTMEADADKEPQPIQLFFEAISTDWWGRHRTEGYAHYPLPLNPGHGTKLLACVRPEEVDTVEAESRRFFVGGCNLIKDLEVLTGPRMQDTNFRYVSSGSISIRWYTIQQACAPGSGPVPLGGRGGSSAALLKGAEAALRQYRKARARLAAATRDIGGGDG